MRKLIRRDFKSALKPLVKKTKAKPEIEVEPKQKINSEDAPYRWHKFTAYKRVEQCMDKVEQLNLDDFYAAIAELRKNRPVATEVQDGDNTITVTNRGFRDQAIRSRVSAIKMRVYRATKELEAAITLLKKTIQYEDAGWLNHTYGKTIAKTAPEYAAIDAQYLADRGNVFLDYVDILLTDIDKAGFKYTNGQDAVARDRVPEKFTRTS